MVAEDAVTILTLNCWGLKFVSKNREPRIQEIARRLRTSSEYDIVVLQEVWVEHDFELIAASTPHLPYKKRFYSGILAGPGLVVLSRYPIVESWLFRFPINGRPSAFFRGDWFVGKSCGSVLIHHPSGRRIEVLNAHMHAPYGPGDANYACHRAAQAWEMSRIAARAARQGHVVFAAGDLNAVPGSVHYDMFKVLGGLGDTWDDLHGEYEGNIASLSPPEQIELAGVTADSQLNTWRQHYPLSKAKRLDYIWYDASTSTPTSAKVAMTEAASCGSVSDHFGFCATFSLNPSAHPKDTKNCHRLGSVLDETLAIITEYSSTCEWQAKWRNAHFWVSVLAFVGLLVGVWFAAEHNRGGYIGFIFTLFGGVILATGLTNGFIGFLFGRNEKRALKEFEDEVWSLRKHLG